MPKAPLIESGFLRRGRAFVIFIFQIFETLLKAALSRCSNSRSAMGGEKLSFHSILFYFILFYFLPRDGSPK